MLRLLRLIRAAKLARALFLMAKNSMTLIDYEDPQDNRYELTRITSPHMEAKLELVRMLRLVTDVSTEFRLGIFMKLFQSKVGGGSLNNNDAVLNKTNAAYRKFLVEGREVLRNPATKQNGLAVINDIFGSLFDQKKYCELDVLMLSTETANISKESNDGDITDICLDLLMYNHTELVGEVMCLLLSYYSQRSYLVSAIEKTQLIVNDDLATKYETARSLAQKIQCSVEAYEAWGESEDKDYVSDELRKLTKWLRQIEDLCKTEANEAAANDEIRPMPEMQTAILNLGINDLIDEMLKVDVPGDEDDDDDDDDIITDIDGNELIDKNVDSLALSGIEEDVIEMLTAFNNFLISLTKEHKEVQEELFGFVDEIVGRIGLVPKSNDLLCAIFEGNEELSCRVSNNLLEAVVIKLADLDEPKYEYLELLHTINLASRQNQMRVLNIITHSRYMKKTLLLYADQKSPEYQVRIKLMQQPNCMEEPLLLYHVNLIRLLANCCDGDFNVAEAKVQSLYNWSSLLYAILDKYVAWNVKLPLLYLFYHMTIEAETKTKPLASSSELVQLLKFFNMYMKNYAEMKPNLILAHLTTMKIPKTRNFWLCKKGAKTVKQITSNKDNLVLFLHYFVFPIVQKLCERYGSDLPEDQFEAIMSQITDYMSSIRNISANVKSETGKQIFESSTAGLEELVKLRFISHEIKKNVGSIRDISTTNAIDTKLSLGSGRNIERRCFDLISTSLLPNSGIIKENIEKELGQLVERIKKKNNENETVNVANILHRVVWLIRRRLVSGNKQYHKVLGVDEEEIAIAESETKGGLQLLLTYIDSCGTELSKDRDILQDQAVNVGALDICIDLISMGLPPDVRYLAGKVATAILVEHGDGGGNVEAQSRVWEYLNSGNSESFFYGIMEQLKPQMVPGEKTFTFTNEQNIELLEMLRLLMEGHYTKNQDILREQPNNKTVVNIFSIVMEYSARLGSNINESNMEVLAQIMDFLVESVQGPCYENQKYLACNTNLLDLCNRLIHYILSMYERKMTEKSQETYGSIILLLLGLLEGRTDKIIHNAILGALNMNNIFAHLKLMREETLFIENSKISTDETDERKDNVLECASDVGSLLLMLKDFNTEWFQVHVEGSRVWSWLNTKMSSVEIFWIGKLHRVFFASPELYDHVVKVSQDWVVENVERTNAETKLRGFLDMSVGLYTEMHHLSNMSKWGMHHIFSGGNLNLAKEISYYLALCINLILLLSYQYGDLWGLTDSRVETLIQMLGIIQMCASFFIFLLFVAVKVPPEFEKLDNIILVLLKTPVLYYLWYAVMAALGVAGNYFFFTLHLLDVVVRDSTTRAVLMAVVHPRLQLLMTLRLMMFVLFIFTMINFQAWPESWKNNECEYLWTCYIAMSNLGVRAGGGVGDIIESYEVTDSRWISRQFFFDMSFFVAINIVLLNVVFGIIIDTFGSLREAKNEKYEDMSNVCFICNIDRNKFEREGINFTQHIKEQHNMWDYLKYMIHIKTKDNSEYNGVEQFVSECITENRIDWFPVNGSMALDTEEGDAELMANVQRMSQCVELVSTELKEIRNSLDINLRVSLEKSSNTLQNLMEDWDEIKQTAEEIREIQ
eukprot:GSMAST32.ASY1.ANO1.410.1 assembled CDS